MTCSVAAHEITSGSSFRSTLMASIVGPVAWATLVASSAGCFVFQATSEPRLLEVLGYAIGFAVASGIAGVAVLALRGKIRWALATGLPILMLGATSSGYLWAKPPSFYISVFFERKYISGCLIVGYVTGGASGLVVGALAAVLAFLAARRQAWAICVLVALLTFAATRWPLDQTVDYAATLGFQLSSPPRNNNQSVWYNNESILGAAEGAAIGGFVGAILGGLATIPRRERVASTA